MRTKQLGGIEISAIHDYAGPNPPLGAIFSYYLSEEQKTAKGERQAEEKTLRDSGDDVPFPGWETFIPGRSLRTSTMEA